MTLLIAALFAWLASAANGRTVDASRYIKNQVDAVVKQITLKHRVPGMSVGVIDDRTDYVFNY